MRTPEPNVVNLRFLYIDSETVIPAKAGIQPRNTGFWVKPGMTNKGKRFLKHYTNMVQGSQRSVFEFWYVGLEFSLGGGPSVFNPEEVVVSR
jgi:hypothetical protein